MQKINELEKEISVEEIEAYRLKMQETIRLLKEANAQLQKELRDEGIL